MQISGVSLALTWPCRLCLLRDLLCVMPLLQAFPFPSTLGGGDTAPAFSGLCVYLQFMWEVGIPPLLWSFPPSATLTSFPAPGCWVQAPAPALCGQARVAYLQFWEGFLPLLQCSGCSTLFDTCLYCSYCLLLSFSFLPGWELVCPGDYADLAQGCLWEYCVPLSSPCLCLPKPSGHGHVAARGPSWFLHLT
jgi:hypothetical protein